MFPDADKFEKRIAKAAANMSADLGIALEIAGEVVRGNIVKGIRDQKWNFKPLAESTLKKKKERQILIETSDYVNSFAVQKTSNLEVQVGTVEPRARALEFGREEVNLPPRPHVGPGFRDSKNEVAKILGDGFAGAFGIRK
jgi:hypothetical protein